MSYSQKSKIRSHSCYYCPRHGSIRKWYREPKQPAEEESKDFSTYCSELFGSSQINGISQIASTKQRFRRLLWVIVFFCCMAGFLYQTISFLIHYCDYPTAVEVLVLNTGSLEFPSVTICNSNRIRKSTYCAYLKERSTRESCSNDSLDENEITALQINILREDKLYIRRMLGHNKTEMFVSCKFLGEPKLLGKECVDRFAHFYDPEFGNCYSFDSSADDGTDMLQATESDVWQDLSELVLILNVEEEEYMESFRDPGFLITFHTAKLYPDPFSDGLQVKPGFTYSFGLQKFTNELLPLPYRTNCTDYSSLPWKRKQTDRKLSTRMCTAECSKNEQLKKCHYVTDEIRLFFDEWDEEKPDIRKVECAKIISNESMDYCRSLCRVPCKQTTFKVTVDSSAWPRKDKKAMDEDLGDWRSKTTEEITKNVARVKVFFSTMEHTVYRNYPKYRPLELFSFLGGYVGIWLGISLVAVYEFFERLVLSLMFRFRKQKRKVKSAKVRQVMATPSFTND